jgi:hypothetical protein
MAEAQSLNSGGDLMTAISRKLAAGLLLGTAMVAFAPHAYADDPPGGHIGPAAGSDCQHYELNTVTTGWVQPATPGTVRCVPVPGAGYKWLPDSGQSG